MFAGAACSCAVESRTTKTGHSQWFTRCIDSVFNNREPSLASLLANPAIAATSCPSQPDTSGELRIDVAINSEKLPGSPFILAASTRAPYPPNCSVAGEALHRATSREQQVAEIRFKDALGNVAHAESVNCYAEPVQVIGLTTHAVELCLPDWLREGEANVTAVISSELI